MFNVSFKNSMIRISFFNNFMYSYVLGFESPPFPRDITWKLMTSRDIPGQKPNIPGHVVADAAGPKRWKMWRSLNYDYFNLMKC